MPVKGFLKAEQKGTLQKAVKESDCALVRERALMLLLMNDGKTYAEISEFLGCGMRTVVQDIKRGKAGPFVACINNS
ncbi:MAG TPA: helix-turn-helix domain-containing protein [Oculatellaceae cyanobacterium]|jgi:DNA-directed RNA polymerase specialized sigma24 family protein